MIVAVKNGVDLLKRPWLNVLVLVSYLEQLSGILHHLDRRSAKLARSNFNVGRVKPVGLSDLTEVVGLGLAAFGDDEDAVITCPSRQLTFKLLALTESARVC
jgi:hypothetical protein